MEINILIGKILSGVDVNEDKTIMKFTAVNGDIYELYHDQDCCESVDIVDISGDLDDLVGSPIVLAREDTSDINPRGVRIPEYQDSFTWTFYNLATEKGYVTIRWYGESNGYYSESVDFRQVGK